MALTPRERAELDDLVRRLDAELRAFETLPRGGPERVGARARIDRLYDWYLALNRLESNPYRGKKRAPRGVCNECAKEVAAPGDKQLASVHNDYWGKPCPGSREPVHRMFNERGEA